MSHRYVYWASAALLVAGAGLVGCKSDDVPTAGASTGAGAAAPAGTTATSAGASGSATSGAAGKSTTATPPTGAAGAKPVAGSGAPATGGAAAPTAGATTATSGSGATAGGAAPAGGTGALPTAGAGTTPPTTGTGGGSCGPATMISAADLGDPMKGRGPWTPMMKASSGPSGSSTLFYPGDLGKDGVKHPVFHWGCGAGSQPSQYADHLNLLASHGIVVIANASGSQPAKASLDWLLGENDKMGSMFYQKLDPKRVAMGGHSLGALETFQGAKDPRITTYILVCGGSGSGTTGAADIHAPSIFLGGEGEGGTMNFVADYDAIKMQPSVFVTKTDTDHIYCARNNLGPWVAFMRWNLCGEEAQWKEEFAPDGTFCKSPWLACKAKDVMF